MNEFALNQSAVVITKIETVSAELRSKWYSSREIDLFLDNQILPSGERLFIANMIHTIAEELIENIEKYSTTNKKNCSVQLNINNSKFLLKAINYSDDFHLNRLKTSIDKINKTPEIDDLVRQEIERAYLTSTHAHLGLTYLAKDFDCKLWIESEYINNNESQIQLFSEFPVAYC